MAFPAHWQYRHPRGGLAARPGPESGAGETVEVSMKRTGWRARWAAIAAATLAAAAICGPVTAAGAAPATGPRVKLIVAQNNVTVPRYGRQVYLDPGIWVASLGSPFELDVQRPDLSTPLSLTQVVHLPGGGTQRIPWPASLLGKDPDRPAGLRPHDRRELQRQGGGVEPPRVLPQRLQPAAGFPQQPGHLPVSAGVRRRSVPEVARSGAWPRAGPSTRPRRAGRA